MPLLLLCVAQFVVVLDVTIVAVALPAIRDALGFSTAGLQWVVTAYTLSFGGLLVAAGRLGDLAGRRRVFRAGLVLFGAASLACALAPGGSALIAARAVQGAGAALQAPAGLALVTATFPDRRRAVAWWTAAAAAGGASGWVLGGVLVEALGWPSVFAVNVPLCAAAALLVPRVLAESRGTARSLDVPGTAAVTAGLSLLVLGLTQAPLALPVAAVALVAFAAIERRARDPILPAWALRRPGFTRANAVALTLTATTTSAMFLAVLFQQEELGRSPLAAGLWSAPLNLAVIAGARVRAPMPAGLAAIAAGALALEAGLLLPAFVLMGLGLGSASVASTASGTEALPAGEQGIASGVLNAAAQIGSALGLAIVVPLGYTAGWATVALLALAVATGSLRTSRRRPTTPRPRRSTPARSRGT
jgi:MFS family permease